eukprot:14589976-Alexandrium_andersonii.AAC.1
MCIRDSLLTGDPRSDSRAGAALVERGLWQRDARELHRCDHRVLAPPSPRDLDPLAGAGADGDLR